MSKNYEIIIAMTSAIVLLTMFIYYIVNQSFFDFQCQVYNDLRFVNNELIY